VTESGCEPIEVVVSEAGGSLRAVLDEPDNATEVYVIAVRMAGRQPVISFGLSYGKEGRTIRRFDRIAPGVYDVYAISNRDPIECQNAAVLRRYAGQATSVEVREGETAQVHVSIIRASQTAGGQ
jgi:hypothetical protein